MKHSMLTRLVIGAALTAAVASVNCGGDDNNPPPGTGGSAGTGGAGVTGGSAGTGGGTGGAAGTGGGTAGSGGAAGTGGVRTDGGTGGTAGTGGTPEGGGTGGARDGGDAEAAAPATFAQVAQILQDHCISCHGGTPDGGAGVPNIIDFRNQSDDAGQTLYDRLTTALPIGQEGQCYFNPLPEGGTGGEAGAEAGANEGGAEASTEAGGAEAGEGGGGGAEAEAGSTRPNRQPIIKGNLPNAATALANSYLYQKLLGGFEGQGQPPVMGNPQASGCGLRMPRVRVTTADGGVTSIACDNAQLDGGAALNCLDPALIAMIASWIGAGAPMN